MRQDDKATDERVLPVPRRLERMLFEYGTRIFNLARRMLNRVEDAEDLTQDVLLKLARKLVQFRGDSSLDTWVYRVTVNAALDFRRKRDHQPVTGGDPYDEFLENGAYARIVPLWRDPQQRALNTEARGIVEQAVQELPENYRDVYLLTDIEELPIVDVSELLQISVAAAKSRLHRSRLLLRQRLSPYFEEPVT